MTARLTFEAMLTELNNTNSPSLLLDDYNHFINKAIGMYINKRYANYDTTQQTTDDLRVLKSTAILPVTKKVIENTTAFGSLEELLAKDKSFNAIYEVNLPDDYLHTLNCLCIYNVTQQSGCYDSGDVARYAAKRLTADSWSVIVNDYYNRPTPKRPYYYIHNINTSPGQTTPTNPYTSGSESGQKTVTFSSKITVPDDSTVTIPSGTKYSTDGNTIITPSADVTLSANTEYYLVTEVATSTNQLGTGTDQVGTYNVNVSSDGDTLNQTGTFNLSRTLGSNRSLIEKTAGQRYGNASTVRMEVRYGQGDVFQLKGVMIDYIKAPQHIRLTKNQLDLTEDTSQVMEFPDYVCQEIINELVKLVMANNADPRLQTVPIVSQSIADPVRQLATNQRAAAAQAGAQ